MQFPDAVGLLGQDRRAEHRRPVPRVVGRYRGGPGPAPSRALGRLAVAIGDVPGDRVHDLPAQTVQPLGVPPLRWVLLPAAGLRHDAAPRRGRYGREVALEERQQTERPERRGRCRAGVDLDPGLERVERDGKVRRRLRLAGFLARPPQPGQGDRFQHPLVVGRQDSGAAASFLPRFGDEPPGDGTLLRRRIQVEREGGRGCRFDVRGFGRLVVYIVAGSAIVPVDMAQRSSDCQAVAGPEGVHPQQSG